VAAGFLGEANHASGISTTSVRSPLRQYPHLESTPNSRVSSQRAAAATCERLLVFAAVISRPAHWPVGSGLSSARPLNSSWRPLPLTPARQSHRPARLTPQLFVVDLVPERLALPCGGDLLLVGPGQRRTPPYARDMATSGSCPRNSAPAPIVFELVEGFAHLAGAAGTAGPARSARAARRRAPAAGVRGPDLALDLRIWPGGSFFCRRCHDRPVASALRALWMTAVRSWCSGHGAGGHELLQHLERDVLCARITTSWSWPPSRY